MFLGYDVITTSLEGMDRSSCGGFIKKPFFFQANMQITMQMKWDEMSSYNAFVHKIVIILYQ